MEPSTTLSDQDFEGPIMTLYPEVMTHIFKFLDVRDRGRAAQTCKYWRDTIYQKSIWRGIEAKMHLRKSGNQIVYQSLSRRGIHKVQVLSLKRSLRELVSGLNTISSLKLSGCYNVTDWTLSSAFTLVLNNLTTLDLSLCKQISDVSLLTISRAPNLQTLELGGCCQISDRGLLLISWGLRKLRRLNCRSCSITDMGISFLAGEVTEAHLRESRMHDFLVKLGLLDEEPSKISQSYQPVVVPMLNHHNSQNNGMPLGPLAKIPRQDNNENGQQQCALCRQVELTSGSSRSRAQILVPRTAHHMVPNNYLVPIVGNKVGRKRASSTSGNSSSVKHRVFYSETMMGTKHGVYQTSNLPPKENTKMKDSFPKIVPGVTEFGTKELRHLVLQDCQKLTDDALASIGNGLESLQSINLSFCVHLSDTGLKHLTRLEKLVDINLRSCEITDAGLAGLNEGGKGNGLSALDISFCDKVGDNGCTYIAHGMTNLTSLSLSACEISDTGLCRIAQALPLLHTLNLGQCAKITDSSLQCIADKCPKLKYIDLYGCPNITPQGLNLLMTMAHMKTLNLGLWHLR